MGERAVQSVRTAAYDALLEMLREAREMKAVSQRELSKRLGQGFTYVVKIERGTRRVDVVELVEICLALGVDPADLVGRLRDEMKGETRPDGAPESFPTHHPS